MPKTQFSFLESEWPAIVDSANRGEASALIHDPSFKACAGEGPDKIEAEPGFERLREKAVQIAALLEEKASIPMVRDQMELILAIQGEEWWRDVTVPMLEILRRRLRDLVRFIEKRSRRPIYTDFEELLRALDAIRARAVAAYGATPCADDGLDKYFSIAQRYPRERQEAT